MPLRAIEVVAVPVHRHAEIDKFADPPPGEGDLVLVGKLHRQGKLPLPGHLGILPALHGLHRVPQFHAVEHPLGGISWQGDLGVGHPTAPLVVEHQAGALVGDGHTSAVGRRARGRPTIGAADDLGVGVEHGHGDPGGWGDGGMGREGKG